MNMQNLQNIMNQAQRMQKEITKKQEEIYKMTFIGESEWIKITLNGKKEIINVEFKYDGSLDSDREMLSDMITIAHKNAMEKIEKEIESKLGMYSKQLGGIM